MLAVRNLQEEGRATKAQVQQRWEIPQLVVAVGALSVFTLPITILTRQQRAAAAAGQGITARGQTERQAKGIRAAMYLLAEPRAAEGVAVPRLPAAM